MRKIIPLWMAFLGLSLWVSCGKSDKSEVSRAAETYYNYLIEGKYEDYVRSIAYSDSMTDSYRSQMVDLVAQYAVREKERRGGVASALEMSPAFFWKCCSETARVKKSLCRWSDAERNGRCSNQYEIVSVS